jgi:hypothetical protein
MATLNNQRVSVRFSADDTLSSEKNAF